MDFGSSARENNNHMGFSHEDIERNTTTMARGNNSYYNKLNFSNYSSSPSSSSSSPHYKTTTTTGGKSFISPGGGGGGGPTWGGDGSSIDDQMNGPDTKLELMNSSPRNDNDVFSMSNNKSSVVLVEREHMFDKVVTPSDVGKLNRLVIPKQHAEKYFPLDSSTNEKGLLLNFEDRNGKPWRFRYSYWNSSQSYVMTKGWSRFVKEKKLDAGDIVSFQRGVGDKDRLFIDWRRRPETVPPEPSAASALNNIPFSFHQHGNSHRSIPWSSSLMRPQPIPMNYGTILNLQPYRNSYGSSVDGGGGGCYNGFGNVVNSVCSPGPVFYLRSSAVAGVTQEEHPMRMVEPQMQHHHGVQQVEGSVVFNSIPVVHGKAATAGKRLRLFGVNMECTPTSDQSEECELISSSQTMSSQAPLGQLRLYNGTPIPGISTVDFLNKGKASISSTFNFDI